MHSHGLWYAVQGTGPTRRVMHRMIFGETDRRRLIDHEDGDGLNNRRRNLRPATRQQNVWNRKDTVGREGMKGIHWVSTAQKWQARIARDGKHKHLGLFESIDDAKAARAEAERRLFGEFARVQPKENVSCA